MRYTVFTMKDCLVATAMCVMLLACGKSSGSDPVPPDTTVKVFAPVAVGKTVSKKVYAHLMPWFETKTTNGGVWGIHWTMSNKNPDITDGTGKRQIASHYYPLIGPYASGDTMVIEYQLLLMKLSGIDGVFIDWPGIQNKFDYPLLVRNTEKIVTLMARVGLQFAIVYEDQNLNHTGVADKVGTAKKDMAYLQEKYFSLPYYEKFNGKPLLMVFGPQALTTPADWSNVFSGLTTAPAFFPLWFESSEAGANKTGEFAWIPQDHLATLNWFYTMPFTGTKFGSAYPGFDSYYAEGGWGGPTWSIDHNGTGTFATTLDLALSKPALPYVQLATWNDYGEGTIIEPTQESGYSYLTMLQQKLGVSSISQEQLEMVAKMYTLRKSQAGIPETQKKMDQVFYYLVSLQFDKAQEILSTFP
ncbi:glycoside hydrolase family 71/99-like protein [Flavihumibacter petaseus]|uniref:Glycosidase n=1 Tax=Flavihumibacter petaseus NBRC 106054 TaxID=1220578 RepID=A0A0E9MVC2_9BACT|nr:glycoside hydrolase family 71/99-like protein [Flavihumibacter petaseus]GAO41428.1 hypothetical protein FPE01S_01_04400 [Flavihumibacter petaseus NBRC 106054]